MHILVCDDDAAFAAQMDEYISEWFRAREIQVQSTVCTSGEQLLATPELGHYQLAFLDVDLKTTDGIALGRKLRQVAPDIVLVYISAYLEFAPQGYTVNAFRYLLKRDIATQLPSCLRRYPAPAYLHLLRQNCRSARHAVRKRLFAGGAQRCGQSAVCVLYPQL